MCMLDQNGDMVPMWQFYGQVILLDISAEWCAPCQELAEGVDHTWLEFKDQGFMYLTLLTEDNNSASPGQDVLQEWANEYEITAPVLSDTEGYKMQLVPNGAYPRVMLIDRNMTIQVDTINPATEEVIREEIINAL
jgi:thiol-disulfide isomerase/thioredoxin